MSSPTTPMPIDFKAQEGVTKYFGSILGLYATTVNIRSQLIARDQAYLRTNDTTEANARAKAANSVGDTTKMQNVTVPVVMPQVESRLSYLQDVFLSGHPIFGTVAPPAQKEAIAQVDAIIEDNSVRGGWANELLLAMRDGLKYDLGAIEASWENKKLFAITTPELKNITQGATKETYYQGNFLKRLDPYNLILDTRVSPEKNHLEGEFAGYTEMISRIALKKRMEDLPESGTMNFKKALESPSVGYAEVGDINAPYFIPILNPDALLPLEGRSEHNWLTWVGAETKKDSIQYKDSYEYSVLYARILPSDFSMKVPAANHVQIWKFIIINRSVVIFAQRQTNAHNFLPIIVCKPSNDGLAWQTRSFAENAIPFQQVSSALVTSAIESQRRKVYDRMLYDPSRVNVKDINNVSSVARIAVKNSTYGKGLSDAVYQIPYRDEGVGEILSLSQQFPQMADIANGQNRVQQGQFQKGNKTRKEFDTVMTNASNRERMMATGLEFTFYVPLKQIILSNILQYQPPTTIVNQSTGVSVEVDPTVLRKANLSFKLSDGFMPTDKIVNTELMGQFFNAAGALPQIAVEYDLMGMFLYSMSLSGASWLQDFKRSPEDQAAYLQQMQAAAQAAGTRNPPPEKAKENDTPQ